MHGRKNINYLILQHYFPVYERAIVGKGNVHRVAVDKPDGKRQLERPKLGWIMILK